MFGVRVRVRELERPHAHGDAGRTAEDELISPPGLGVEPLGSGAAVGSGAGAKGATTPLLRCEVAGEPLPHRLTEGGGARERRRRGAALLPKNNKKNCFQSRFSATNYPHGLIQYSGAASSGRLQPHSWLESSNTLDQR